MPALSGVRRTAEDQHREDPEIQAEGNGEGRVKTMANDYLFTWKQDKWPYEKLRALVDAFEAGKQVTEPWRCLAHNMVKQGDSAYVLKQGRGSRGIFGVGTISG